MWPAIGPIPTFGILYFIGIAVHFCVSWRVARRYGLERRVWITVSLCYLLSMLVGAKLLYDIRHGVLDLAALVSPRHYLQGGLWGGLLAYFVLAVPFAVLLTKQRRAALDLIALSLPIPWMIAKLGCLLNGCCYGRACSLPWAITFPAASTAAPAGIRLHPTQVYEMALMGLLILVFGMLRRRHWRGTMLLWFLIIYGFGRAVTDLFRGDMDRYIYIGPVTLTQLICLAQGIIAFSAVIWYRSRLPMQLSANKDADENEVKGS